MLGDSCARVAYLVRPYVYMQKRELSPANGYEGMRSTRTQPPPPLDSENGLSPATQFIVFLDDNDQTS